MRRSRDEAGGPSTVRTRRWPPLRVRAGPTRREHQPDHAGSRRRSRSTEARAHAISSARSGAVHDRERRPRGSRQSHPLALPEINDDLEHVLSSAATFHADPTSYAKTEPTDAHPASADDTRSVSAPQRPARRMSRLGWRSTVRHRRAFAGGQPPANCGRACCPARSRAGTSIGATQAILAGRRACNGRDCRRVVGREIEWPAPQRISVDRLSTTAMRRGPFPSSAYTSAGEHTGRSTADAAIVADVGWIVCQDVCVPGQAAWASLAEVASPASGRGRRYRAGPRSGAAPAPRSWRATLRDEAGTFIVRSSWIGCGARDVLSD